MIRKRTIKLTATAIALALALAPATFAGNGDAQTLADFSLRSIDGQTITSESLRGEVVVLAIGASWLPLSRPQIQGVRKLADAYSSKGVIVYWVSTDSENPKSKNYASDEALRAYARKNELNLTVLRDPDGSASRRMGVDQAPSLVILNKQGYVDGEPIGGIDPSGNLVELLAPRLNKLL